MTNKRIQVDELDEILRRVHFSQANFYELTKEEINEDIDKDCQKVINKGRQLVEALIQQKQLEARLDELTDYRKNWHTMLRQEPHQDLNDRIAQLSTPPKKEETDNE